MSETLYTRCAEVLAHCQAQLKDDLPALLDPASGFAPQLRQICTQWSVPVPAPSLVRFATRAPLTPSPRTALQI